MDSLKLKIHLVWKDFIVTVRDLRLKFLFKKDRYQISIKGDNRIKNFTINGESLSFVENRYHKTYYIPEKSEAIFDAYYFDEYGRAVNIENLDSITKVYLHAVVQNKYGQIINRIHVRKNLTNKNTILNSLDTLPDKIDSTKPFDFVIPKGGVVLVDPDFNDSILTKLLHTDCSLLEKQLNIFTSNKELLSTIRKEFYDVFDFSVNINFLSKMNLTFNTINIIVADKYPGKLIRTSPYFDEVLIKQNGQKKALLISEKNFTKWLKNIAIWKF